MGPTGPAGPPGPAGLGGLAVVTASDGTYIGAWTPEPNYDLSNAWVTIVANGTALRIPLSTWKDAGPPGTVDVPELLGLTRASLQSFYPTADCSGKPFSGAVTWDGTGKRLPGIRTVVLAPVAGTRTIQYYDAAFVAYGSSRTAFSRAYYDAATGNFACASGFSSTQQLTGIGSLLFDSTALPPEPYRIE